MTISKAGGSPVLAFWFRMAPRSAAIGQVISGKYRLLERLGGGGMGDVFRAEHELAGRIVALKLLRADFADDRELTRRFFQEAQAVNRIRHPNIVDVLDAGFSEAGPYVAMECLEGCSLNSALRAVGRLDISTALSVVLPMLDALGAAHRHGIIHRDLKPENVFLANMHADSSGSGGRSGAWGNHPEVRVKLVDFGIAKMTHVSAGPSPRTNTGTIFGTPDYLSPEQATGLADIDGRSDIFAVGIVLFELLTGRRPFEASNAVATAYRIVHQAAPTVASFGIQVDALVQAVLDIALAKNVPDRFATAHSFADMLAPLTPDGATRRESLRHLLHSAGVADAFTSTGGGVFNPTERAGKLPGLEREGTRPHHPPARPVVPPDGAEALETDAPPPDPSPDADATAAPALMPTNSEARGWADMPSGLDFANDGLDAGREGLAPPTLPSKDVRTSTGPKPAMAPPAVPRPADSSPSAPVSLLPSSVGRDHALADRLPPSAPRSSARTVSSSGRVASSASSSTAAAPPSTRAAGSTPHHLNRTPGTVATATTPRTGVRATGGGSPVSPFTTAKLPADGAESQNSTRQPPKARLEPGWAPRPLPAQVKGKFHTRGTLPRAVYRWLERAFGKEARASVAACVPPEHAETFRNDGFNALVWYELEVTDTLIEAATAMLLGGHVGAWREMARDNFEQDFAPILRPPHRTDDPVAVLKRSPTGWARIYDFGGMRVSDGLPADPGRGDAAPRALVHVDGFEPASLALRYITVGTVEGMLRSPSWVAASVKVTAGEASFAKEFEFEVVWAKG